MDYHIINTVIKYKITGRSRCGSQEKPFFLRWGWLALCKGSRLSLFFTIMALTLFLRYLPHPLRASLKELDELQEKRGLDPLLDFPYDRRRKKLMFDELGTSSFSTNSYRVFQKKKNYLC